MYLFCFILVLSVNIIVPIFVGTNIYLSLAFCFANVILYPVFLRILTTKTSINNPIIKDLTYSNYNYLSKTEYIVFECKRLLRYNVPWFFLILTPFIINFLIDRNTFGNMSMIDLFTIISLFNLALLIVGISSIIKNFYPKYSLYFYLLLANILLWSIVLDSTGETKHLLYISVFLNLFCFLVGILLFSLEKKKKISSVV